MWIIGHVAGATGYTLVAYAAGAAAGVAITGYVVVKVWNYAFSPSNSSNPADGAQVSASSAVATSQVSGHYFSFILEFIKSCLPTWLGGQPTPTSSHPPTLPVTQSAARNLPHQPTTGLPAISTTASAPDPVLLENAVKVFNASEEHTRKLEEENAALKAKLDKLEGRDTSATSEGVAAAVIGDISTIIKSTPREVESQFLAHSNEWKKQFSALPLVQQSELRQFYLKNALANDRPIHPELWKSLGFHYVNLKDCTNDICCRIHSPTWSQWKKLLLLSVKNSPTCGVEVWEGINHHIQNKEEVPLEICTFIGEIQQCMFEDISDYGQHGAKQAETVTTQLLAFHKQKPTRFNQTFSTDVLEPICRAGMQHYSDEFKQTWGANLPAVPTRKASTEAANAISPARAREIDQQRDQATLAKARTGGLLQEPTPSSVPGGIVEATKVPAVSAVTPATQPAAVAKSPAPVVKAVDAPTPAVSVVKSAPAASPAPTKPAEAPAPAGSAGKSVPAASPVPMKAAEAPSAPAVSVVKSAPAAPPVPTKVAQAPAPAVSGVKSAPAAPPVPMKAAEAPSAPTVSVVKSAPAASPVPMKAAEAPSAPAVSVVKSAPAASPVPMKAAEAPSAPAVSVVKSAPAASPVPMKAAEAPSAPAVSVVKSAPAASPVPTKVAQAQAPAVSVSSTAPSTPSSTFAAVISRTPGVPAVESRVESPIAMFNSPLQAVARSSGSSPAVVERTLTPQERRQAEREVAKRESAFEKFVKKGQKKDDPSAFDSRKAKPKKLTLEDAYNFYAKALAINVSDEFSNNAFEYMNHKGKTALLLRMLFISLDKLSDFVDRQTGRLLVPSNDKIKFMSLVNGAQSALTLLLESKDLTGRLIEFAAGAQNLNIILASFCTSREGHDLIRKLYDKLSNKDGFYDEGFKLIFGYQQIAAVLETRSEPAPLRGYLDASDSAQRRSFIDDRTEEVVSSFHTDDASSMTTEDSSFADDSIADEELPVSTQPRSAASFSPPPPPDAPPLVGFSSGPNRPNERTGSVSLADALGKVRLKPIPVADPDAIQKVLNTTATLDTVLAEGLKNMRRAAAPEEESDNKKAAVNLGEWN